MRPQVDLGGNWGRLSSRTSSDLSVPSPLPTSGFAINGSVVVRAFPDVTSLGCSVRTHTHAHAMTQIEARPCKSEATASMRLGFSRCAARSVLVPPVLMGFPDLLRVKSCSAQTVRVELKSHEVI